MATPVLIPVEEYLNSSYEPDCHYVNGELKERNAGEKPHGHLQGLLYNLFFINRREWGLLPIVEQRVQTREAHYRILDVCAIRPVAGEYVVQSAPVLCVEVLSKGESLQSLREKADEYLAMGVAHVWMAQPLEHRVYRATADGYEPVKDVLAIEGTPVRIDLGRLFAEFEELIAGRL